MKHANNFLQVLIFLRWCTIFQLFVERVVVSLVLYFILLQVNFPIPILVFCYVIILPKISLEFIARQFDHRYLCKEVIASGYLVSSSPQTSFSQEIINQASSTILKHLPLEKKRLYKAWMKCFLYILLIFMCTFLMKEKELTKQQIKILKIAINKIEKVVHEVKNISKEERESLLKELRQIQPYQQKQSIQSIENQIKKLQKKLQKLLENNSGNSKNISGGSLKNKGDKTNGKQNLIGDEHTENTSRRNNKQLLKEAISLTNKLQKKLNINPSEKTQKINSSGGEVSSRELEKQPIFFDEFSVHSTTYKGWNKNELPIKYRQTVYSYLDSQVK